jgi:hypothetical protein
MRPFRRCNHSSPDTGWFDLIGGNRLYVEWKCPFCGQACQRVPLSTQLCQWLAVPIVFLAAAFVWAIPPWEWIGGFIKPWFPGLSRGWSTAFPFTVFALGLAVTGAFFRVVGLIFRTNSRWLRVLFGWGIVAFGIGILPVYYTFRRPDPEHPRVRLVLKSENANQRVPETCGLGHEWNESEYGFIGTWKRRDATNTFDARWIRGSEVGEATLKIDITGQHVVVERYQHGGVYDNGRCNYEGTLQSDMRTVDGTYRCSWSPEVPAWRAVIKCP